MAGLLTRTNAALQDALSMLDSVTEKFDPTQAVPDEHAWYARLDAIRAAAAEAQGVLDHAVARKADRTGHEFSSDDPDLSEPCPDAPAGQHVEGEDGSCKYCGYDPR